MKKDRFLAALVMTSCLFSVSLFASPQACAAYTLDQQAEITLWTDYIKDYANDAFGYISRANIHMEAREFANAIADYDAALKIDQYNTDAYVKRANAKYQLNQPEAALKDYAVALEINPALPEARFNVGRIFYNAQNYPKAVEQMRAAVKLAQDIPVYHFELARAEYKAGLYADSYANFSKAIELKEDYVDAYYGNALAAMNLGKYGDAVTCFDKVIASGQRYENAHFYKGIANYQLGQYEKAIADFDIALEENPEDGYVYNARGKAKELLGENFAAKRDYKKAKALGVTAIGLTEADKVKTAINEKVAKVEAKAEEVTNDVAQKTDETVEQVQEQVQEVATQVKQVETAVAETVANAEEKEFVEPPLKEEEKVILDEATNRRLAAENIAAGDVYSAVALYDNVVEFDPTNSTNYIDRANLKLQVEDFDGVLKDAEIALKIDKAARKDALFLQGRAYEGKGNNVLAYRAFALALREDTQNPQYQYHFAKNAFEVGRFAEANEVFSTLLEENSAQYPDAYLLRSKTRYQMAEFYSSIADATKYLTLEPKNSEAYFYRAMCKNALKNHDEAVEDLKAAVKYDRDNVMYRAFRAKTYMAMGEHKKAAADYRKIVAIKKDNATTDDHLRVAETEVLSGDYEEALLYYDLIVKDNVYSDVAYLDRARLYSLMGQVYNAINDYTYALKMNPNQKVVYKERGILYVDTKAYRRGILDLTEALKLEPDNGKLYFYRAVARQAAGDKDGALQDFDAAKRFGEDL